MLVYWDDWNKFYRDSHGRVFYVVAPGEKHYNNDNHGALFVGNIKDNKLYYFEDAPENIKKHIGKKHGEKLTKPIQRPPAPGSE